MTLWLNKTKRSTDFFPETILMTFNVIFIDVIYEPCKEFLQHLYKILDKVHWQSQITANILRFVYITTFENIGETAKETYPRNTFFTNANESFVWS